MSPTGPRPLALDFRILGPLEVLADGRRLALPGSKPRALLALLLLHANEPLTTDRLIDELWGERPPAGAAKTLQMQVSRVRKALAAEDSEGATGLIVTRGRGYELVLDPERLDSRRFERLVADGRRELAAGRVEAAVTAFEEALAQWRGEPLSDLAYEPFAQPEIARLDDLRLGAEEQLIEAKLALGRHAEVVERLEALIAAHPFREGIRAQLMLALYRCDRQAEALQAYQDARRSLVEELGIEPGERLRDLERAILAQDPSLRLVVPDQPPSGPAPDVPRRALVGRERELAELVAALDEGLTGRSRVVLLAGEPGIGKSRLAEALMDHARARGASVVAGRCWEAGGAPAYWPWIQALRVYVGDTDPEALRAQLGAGATDLGQLLPELRELFPHLGEPPTLEGDGSRFRLFEAVRSFLRAAAEGRPLVVVLDDLHAADEPSLLLLRFVARGLIDSRLLIVGAYRDVDPTLRDPLTSTLADLAREGHTTQVTLTGLSAPAIAEYVVLTTGLEATPALVDAIHAETEGNPLFVSETLRLLAAEGRVGEADAHLKIPPGVRAVIGRRVARLSSRCQSLLVQASVIGREFGLDALTALGGLGTDELMDVLNEAMAERVLDEVPGVPGRVRFGHVLIRDTLYDGLTAARRMQLHKDVAEALEVAYSADPEPHLAELAQHFVAAAPIGAADKAIRYARRAGERAARQLAFEEAARHFEIALTLGDDQRERCELLLALGDAHARAGDTPSSKSAFREAADLAEREGLPRQLARAALGYGGRFAWARASTDPALMPLLERALAAIDERDSSTKVMLLARLAGAARDEPRRERRVALAEEALDIARRIGDPVTLVAAVEGHWIAAEAPDRLLSGEGIAGAGAIISLGEQIGDKEKVFAGHDHRLHCLWQVGDRAGVEAELQALSELAAELRQPAQHWHVGTGRTMLALMEGRFADAETLIAETLTAGRRANSWNAFVTERLALFVLRRAQGRIGELEDAIARSVHEYPALFRFRCALAHLYGELGREQDARIVLDTVLTHDLAHDYVDAEWLFSLSLLAEPCARLSDERGAAQVYSVLRPYEGLYAQAPVEAVFGSVARVLGVLATTLRRFDEAERHFDVAIDTERRMRARPWRAHAQHDLAGMLLVRRATGDRERARALLDEALATYTELGMDTWAVRAEALASSASVGGN